MHTVTIVLHLEVDRAGVDVDAAGIEVAFGQLHADLLIAVSEDVVVTAGAQGDRAAGSEHGDETADHDAAQ